MRCSMQQIFDAHFDDYAAGRALHPREALAAWCIRHCYTSACGSHVLRCPAGHVSTEQFHACGHRSCPRCAGRTRAAWIDAQLTRLLPCPHFHVVFTLPHELLPLWESNRAALTQLLFDCVRHSLLELLADPRHLGATAGLLMSLHTWGRNLSHHPHVHALVSAGGLTPDLRWKATRAGFLLPLKPLQFLFRGKLLAGLREMLDAGALKLPSGHVGPSWSSALRALYRKHWNIQINPPYASGRSVALYLARYVRGGPLPRQRPLFLDHGVVSLDYTDHRDGQAKRLHLQHGEFIARVLWHAPPKGVHTVRHAGLYASASKHLHLVARLALCLPAAPPELPAHAPCPPPPSSGAVALCPVCRAPLWRSYIRHDPRRLLAKDQISLINSDPSPATSAHPGPTRRWSRHSTAGMGRDPPNVPILSAARPMPAVEC